MNQGDGANGVVRLKIERRRAGTFADIARTIEENGGEIAEVELVKSIGEWETRDFFVGSRTTQQLRRISEAAAAMPGVEVIHAFDATFRVHLGGKIEVRNKVPLATREDLARAYTPGFAHVAKAIHQSPEEVYRLTIKQNTVAIVTDGTAVSGIGDVGPEAALPVMEGKAMLFKRFADINAFPLCLATKNVDEIVRIVRCIEPTFAGIMLEDISAPRCFEIEDRLRRELTIPVLHDDQHATAVAATAALINALRLVDKEPASLKIVMVGAGAAGTAAAKLFMQIGAENIVACDRKGAIHRGRNDLNDAKRWFADHANPEQESGDLAKVIAGADLFVGLAGPGVVTPQDIRRMGRDPIVFALANPHPEILPEQVGDTVAVIATGRSDYPNQIDCGLCYPGMFRGALDCRAREINEEMKLAAAYAIADAVDAHALNARHVIPSIFDDKVSPNVAAAVMKAAIDTGMARMPSQPGPCTDGAKERPHLRQSDALDVVV